MDEEHEFTLKPPEMGEESRPKHGGRRPGAGRKPGLARKLREAFIADKHETAEYAFKLYSDTLQDESAPLDVRLACGQEIMNRVWGRPRQAIEHSGEDGGPVVVQYINDWRGQAPGGPGDRPALPPPGPEGCQDAGEAF